jgi:hypothetical protein
MNLFIDKEFDKDLKSIDLDGIIWKRPHDIVNEPVFIFNDISIDDICQGFLGDCWLIATINVLFNSFENFISILNPLQTFHKSVYNGKFSFNFVIDNKKCKIEIDDLLPTYNNKLIFCRNKSNKNEFWCSLFEKAVAKIVNNSYDSIGLGRDLYGALEYFNIQDYDLMNSIDCDIDFKKYHYLLGSDVDRNDIVSLHVYSVLDYSKNVSNNKELIKIKNPYNNNIEFSKQLMLTNDCENKSNGIFWMENDFYEYFPYILQFKTNNNYSDYLNKPLYDDLIIKEKKWQTITTASSSVVLIGIVLNNENNRNEKKNLKYTCSSDSIYFEKNLLVDENNKQSYFSIELCCKNLFANKNFNQIVLNHELSCQDKLFLHETFIISKTI